MPPSNPKNECYTPSYFIDPIRNLVNGFDLDPFSTDEANEAVKADCFLDENLSALKEDWFEYCWTEYPTFWINPPYSRDLIKLCIEKTLSYVGKAEIYLLVNSQTSSVAYRSCVAKCDAMLFPHKRIQFVNPYTPYQGFNDRDQTLFYFGVHPLAFGDGLTALGEPIVKRKLRSA